MRKNIKLIAILVLICALAVVALQNRSPVQTDFLLISMEMPQILLLLLTAGIGFALGLLTSFFKESKPKGPKS